MSFKGLEGTVNRRLRAINPGYKVSGLRQAPDGDYWFDLALAFRPQDMPRVNQVFQELLGDRRVNTPRTVQAKFYLHERTVQRLRQKAVKSRKSQSELVEEALQLALK